MVSDALGFDRGHFRGVVAAIGPSSSFPLASSWRTAKLFPVQGRVSSAVWTETFTPNEAAALVDVPPKQVRKEIEYAIIDRTTPPRLSFAALVYLRALKLMDLQLNVADRERLARRLFEAISSSPTVDIVDVTDVVALRVGSLVEELVERVERFERWRDSLVRDPNTMGGEPVFPSSRLTVRRVGSMLERGESPDAILADYSYLTPEDLDYARVYVRAYPHVGRPRATAQAAD